MFLDIRDKVAYGGEQGLLGLAFDPALRANRFALRRVHVRHGRRHAVVRYRSNGTRAIPSSRTAPRSSTEPYGNHNGGHLAFGPDGLLYTSIGDGGSGGDPENRAQNMQSRSSASC